MKMGNGMKIHGAVVLTLSIALVLGLPVTSPAQKDIAPGSQSMPPIAESEQERLINAEPASTTSGSIESESRIASDPLGRIERYITETKANGLSFRLAETSFALEDLPLLKVALEQSTSEEECFYIGFAVAVVGRGHEEAAELLLWHVKRPLFPWRGSEVSSHCYYRGSFLRWLGIVGTSSAIELLGRLLDSQDETVNFVPHLVSLSVASAAGDSESGMLRRVQNECAMGLAYSGSKLAIEKVVQHYATFKLETQDSQDPLKGLERSDRLFFSGIAYALAFLDVADEAGFIGAVERRENVFPDFEFRQIVDAYWDGIKKPKWDF